MKSATVSTFLGLVLAASSAAWSAEPDDRAGRITRLAYRTAQGVQVVPGLPLIPVTEQPVSQNYDMPDGRRVHVMFQAANNQLAVKMAAAPADGIQEYLVTLSAVPGERFYGLMERIVDGDQANSWKPGMTETLDLRGQSVSMYVKPTVGLYAPCYVSSAGYGIFVEGSWPGTFDMAKTRATEVTFSNERPVLSFQLVRRSTPIEAVEQLVRISGLPTLPPRWAFRPWRWRDEHTQRDKFWDGTPYHGPYNAEVVEDILMMEALDIPCGVYWVDRPWAKGVQGYEDFDWDTDRLPNPREMIAWLSKRDIRFLLWIAPWTLGKMNEEGRAKGYFMQPTYPEKDGRCFIDFTNPEAKSWWQARLQKLADDGVAGFKLDRSEENIPDTREQMLHSGISARQMHNVYPLEYARAAYEALKGKRSYDFVVMPRAGYAGSQQYAVFWGGDTSGTPWGLRSAIIALQRAAVMGFDVWGSDTGGYTDSNRETTARWLAFSAFCPLMEVGPTSNVGFWNAKWEPHYDAELLAMWSLYAKVHDRLGDYLYALAEKAANNGEMIVRPLCLQFPKDDECAKRWDEYMLGGAILVCPLWQEGATKRDVYLPAGEWLDPWNGNEVLSGPRTLSVDCPLHKIPIYVRRSGEKGKEVKPAVDLSDMPSMYEAALKRAKDKPDMAKLLVKAGLEQK